MDVISFLGLAGLFNAHITGNLVILAARIVGAGPAPVAIILSVPIFMLALFLTRLLSRRLESGGLDSLRPLLLIEVLLLAGFFGICVFAGSRVDPTAATGILGGMLGVSAMAVQNALVQVSLTGVPATTAMTANITRFTLDLVDVLAGRDPDAVAAARRRASATWPPIAGFAVGCGAGAVCEAALAMRALALPLGLAVLAFILSSVGQDTEKHRA